MAAGPRPTAKPRPKPTPSKLASPKPPDRHVLQGGAAGQVVDRHELQGLAAEDPPAVELAAVGQHLAEGHVVVGGRDQPAGAREIGAGPPDRVGERALHEAGRVGRAVLVAGGQAGQRLLGDEEPRVDHAEWLEELALQVLVEGQAREDLDQAAHDVGRDPVVPVRPGVELQRVLGQERRDALERLPGPSAAPGLVERGVDGVAGEQAAGQAGRVHQDVAHVHRALGLDQGDRCRRRRPRRPAGCATRGCSGAPGRAAGTCPARRAASGRPRRWAWSWSRCGRWRRRPSASACSRSMSPRERW